MDDIKKIIIKNYEKYPELQIQDILKLIYQNEFGCGHLVADPQTSFERLTAEWNSVEGSEDEDLFEPIGNGFSRMNIAAAKSAKMPIELFHKLFIQSATKQTGTVAGFIAKTEIVKELCSLGKLPFEVSEVDTFVSKWELDNHPLFSHSVNYRKHYHPAYRVVFSQYSALMPLLQKIYESQNSGAVIAIEGRCGSGKTTMAQMLAELYDATVIHMDDFFLPKELRTAERLSEPGGNIHYERFCSEVIDGLKSKKPFSYRVYNCAIMDYDNKIAVEHKPITIVEGAYSLHPLFELVYDIKVFCDIDKDKQKNRIIKRNELEGYGSFRDRWIPLEEKYLSEMNVIEKCDFIISI